MDNYKKTEFQKELDRIILQLCQVNEELTARIPTYPAGRLRIDNKPEHTQFYHCKPGDKKRGGIYIRKSDIELAEALAQKEYEKRLYNEINEQLEMLEQVKKIYNPRLLQQGYEKLTEVRRQLVKPIVPTDQEYVEKWMKKEYNRKGFLPGEPEYYTNSGIRVRSKSEILLGNRFEYFGIPYRYEYPLFIDGNTLIHPDFLLLNIRKREEYYWEHCGMTSKSFYKEDMTWRNAALIRNGIIPGISLIYSFESSDSPLNMKSVDKLIETFLL